MNANELDFLCSLRDTAEQKMDAFTSQDKWIHLRLIKAPSLPGSDVTVKWFAISPDELKTILNNYSFPI